MSSLICIYIESSSNNRLNSDTSTTGRNFYINLILSVLLTQTRFIYNDHKCRLFFTVNIFCLSRKNLYNYYTLLNSYSWSLFFICLHSWLDFLQTLIDFSDLYGSFSFVGVPERPLLNRSRQLRQRDVAYVLPINNMSTSI